MRLLCSTGALIGRPNGRDWRLLSPCRERLSADGLEFMMYDTWYGQWEDIAAFLGSLGMEIPVFHCEKTIGEAISLGQTDDAMERFTVNCRMAARIGASLMVMHLWDGKASDTRMDRNLSLYPRLRETAEKHGLTLTVENVVCSLLDPLTHWREILNRHPDARFTFDTKMAAFHGQIDAMYREENRDLWGHIAHLHLNDYAGGYRDWNSLRTLHPGDGQVDFQALFAFLTRIGYHGDCTAEATSFLPDGEIRWDRMNESLNRLRGLAGRE